MRRGEDSMRGLVVAIFENEARAHAGLDALAALHAEGALSVYTAASIAWAGRSSKVVPDGADRMRLQAPALGDIAASPAVAAALGALLSLTSGPLALAMSSVPAALIGTVRELDEAGVDAGFLERVVRRLSSGGACMLAEVAEENEMALDARIVALGGRVFRRCLDRAPPAEERLLREISALRGEGTDAQSRSAIVPAPIDATNAAEARRLRACALRLAVERATSLADALRREVSAKVAILREQASHLPGRRSAMVADRAPVVRAALEARISLLVGAAHRIPASPLPGDAAPPPAQANPNAS